jgi:hypothetical protein
MVLNVTVLTAQLLVWQKIGTCRKRHNHIANRDIPRGLKGSPPPANPMSFRMMLWFKPIP